MKITNCILFLAVSAVCAQGAGLGLNWVGSGETLTDSGGAFGVPLSSWANLTGASGSTTFSPPSGGTISVSWNSEGAYGTGPRTFPAPYTAGNYEVISGDVYASQCDASTPISVTVSGMSTVTTNSYTLALMAGIDNEATVDADQFRPAVVNGSSTLNFGTVTFSASPGGGFVGSIAATTTNLTLSGDSFSFTITDDSPQNVCSGGDNVRAALSGLTLNYTPIGSPPPSTNTDLAEYTFQLNASPDNTAANIFATTAAPVAGGLSTFAPGTTETPSYGVPVLQVNPANGATSEATAVADNSYFSFSVGANPGYVFTPTNLSFNIARGGASTPRGYTVRSSLDGYTSDLASALVTTARPTFTAVSIPLPSAFQNLPSVNFRIYIYTPGTGGSEEINNLTVNGTTSTVVAGLLFTTQPGAANPGAPFGQQPVLKTVDQFGNPTTVGLAATQYVTASLSSGTGPLLGTVTYNIGTGAGGSNGVVNFSNLQINTPGTNYALTAAFSSSLVPTNIAGCQLWLDASDTNTVTASPTVTDIADKSGNANDFDTPVGDDGDIAYTNTLDGLPVLTFSGGDSGSMALHNTTYRNSGTTVTWFTVWRHSSATPNNFETPLSSSDGSDPDYNQTDCFAPSATTPGGFIVNPQQERVTVVDLFYTAFNIGTAPHIMDGLFDGANSALYLDGYLSDRHNASSGSFNIQLLSLGQRLDQGASSSVSSWQGDIAEVIVYNSALSASDQASVRSYLNAKWVMTQAASAPFSVGSGSSFVLIHPAYTNGTFSVTVQSSLNGKNYQLQYKNSLANSSWTPLASTPGNGGAIVLTDSPAVPQRFYRVEQY